ncbi:MAG: hypothetical protein U0T69_07125 [Chitinophagales bacterium]
MRNKLNNIAQYALTFDVDWAPDYAIDFVTQYLIEKKVKSTWFITHLSPAIERLKLYPELFELGLHPNFLPNSSHGKTEEEVMATLLDMVKGAKVLRAHCLVQSSRLLGMMVRKFGIEVDCSLFLPKSSNIEPHIINYDENVALVRIPYFWEDDEECYDPKQSWDFQHSKYHVSGLKIFNFHPTYIYLNCSDMKGYEEVKQFGYLADIEEETIQKYINPNNGVRNIFEGYVDFISKGKQIQMNMTEISKEYLKYEYFNFK